MNEKNGPSIQENREEKARVKRGLRLRLHETYRTWEKEERKREGTRKRN
jgi:hypothetical protein